MPRPIFIICSEGGSEDKLTGLVSAFNIFDTVKIQGPPEKRSAPLVQMRVTVLWMREPNDADTEFDFEARILIPPDDVVHPLQTGRFRFKKHFQRLIVRIFGPLPIAAGGMMRVQCRIRPVGSDGDWHTQEYPVVIEHAAVEPSLPQDANQA